MFIFTSVSQELNKMCCLLFRDLDELSDLSENISHSDVSLPEDSNEEDELDDDADGNDDSGRDFAGQRYTVKARRRKSRSDDSAVQGSTSESKIAVSHDASNVRRTSRQFDSAESMLRVNKVDNAESKPTITAEKLLALEVVSTENEEHDPKFLLRPTDVTVMEGEVATFFCKVSGTEPIGKP